jgi:excisionase family DNA binding protein
MDTVGRTIGLTASLNTVKHLTVGEAAALLGSSRDAVRKWVDAGHLRHVESPGGHRWFQTQDVIAFQHVRASRMCVLKDCDKPLPTGARMDQDYCSKACRDRAGSRRLREAALHPCACCCGRLTANRWIRGHYMQAKRLARKYGTDWQSMVLLAKPRGNRRAEPKARQHRVELSAIFIGPDGRTAEGSRAEKGLRAKHGGMQARTWLGRQGGKASSKRTKGRPQSAEHVAKRAAQRKSAHQTTAGMSGEYYAVMQRIRPWMTLLDLLILETDYSQSDAIELAREQMRVRRGRRPTFAADDVREVRRAIQQGRSAGQLAWPQSRWKGHSVREVQRLMRAIRTFDTRVNRSKTAAT